MITTKKKNPKTKCKQICDKAQATFNKQQNKKTREQYIKNFRKFARYCTSQKGVKDVNELYGNKAIIQSYADSLKEEGKSASTVHTYIAPACIFCGINMSEIEKDKRRTAEYTKGRTKEGKVTQGDKEKLNPKYERSVKIQSIIGIRRNELKRLTGADFYYDEQCGYYYVFVRKGKGGKSQKQRIFPEEAEYISQVFSSVKPEEKIFSPEELNNKINYHAMRAERAKYAYRYYLEYLSKDSSNREKLKMQIWKRMHDKKGFRATKSTYEEFTKEVTGIYRLRGENKRLASEHGLPLEYDKLAVMAVSVFHLSHWRNDVTMQSYLLTY